MMIEAIVAYIQGAGYKVDVREGYIVIWTTLGGQTIALNWMIDKVDLAHLPWKAFEGMANRKIWEIDCEAKTLPGYWENPLTFGK